MAIAVNKNKIEAQRQSFKRGEWSETDMILGWACAEGDRRFYGLPKDDAPMPWEYAWTVQAINEALEANGYRIAKKPGRPKKEAALCSNGTKPSRSR